MITIRPFDYSRADYALAIGIEAAVFNEAPMALDEWLHDDRTHAEGYLFQREIILRDGQPVGYAEVMQNPYAYHPHKVEFRVFVYPDRDAPDIRPAYLAHMMAALRRDHPDLAAGLIALTSGMLSDKPEAVRFFAENGFEEVAREAISKLDVIAFDPAPYAPLLARLRAEGIAITTLRELDAADPDCRQKLFDLDTAISRDIPSTGDKRPPEFGEWQARRLAGPGCDPDGWFIAVAGDQYVGESQGRITAPGLFEMGATGVRRAYRRRGIATALKVHAIQYARARGVAEIFTTNDSRNPMYQLNLALGFRPQPSWMRVEKALAAQPVE